jgi:hypothetical protein
MMLLHVSFLIIKKKKEFNISIPFFKKNKLNAIIPNKLKKKKVKPTKARTTSNATPFTHHAAIFNPARTIGNDASATTRTQERPQQRRKDHNNKVLQQQHHQTLQIPKS